MILNGGIHPTGGVWKNSEGVRCRHWHSYSQCKVVILNVGHTPDWWGLEKLGGVGVDIGTLTVSVR